jgi:hypothetical protein
MMSIDPIRKTIMFDGRLMDETIQATNNTCRRENKYHLVIMTDVTKTFRRNNY